MSDAQSPSAPGAQLKPLKSSLEPGGKKHKTFSWQLICPALDIEASAKIPPPTLRNPLRTSNRENEGEENPWGFTPGLMLQGEGSCLLDQVIPCCC